MKIRSGERGRFRWKSLDYWEAVEETAKTHPGIDFVEVLHEWMAENPGVIAE